MFNRIILMGRLVADPELATTAQGTDLCQFRIAVDRRFHKQGEERKTDFFNVAAWRQTARFVRDHFGKGSMILIEGELATRPYTDKNGNAATWYEIVADQVSFTGDRRGLSDSDPVPTPEPQPAPPAAPGDNGRLFADDPDYPF